MSMVKKWVSSTIKVSHFENERPERYAVFMAIAQVMSLRGTCQRAKVGCIITSPDHRIISSGYNGTLIRAPHCTEMGCNLEEKCQHSVHAEANAISFAARFGISLSGSIMFCTTAPCKSCAMLIIQAGVHKVVYLSDYTDNIGIKMLTDHNIGVQQYE